MASLVSFAGELHELAGLHAKPVQNIDQTVCERRLLEPKTGKFLRKLKSAQPGCAANCSKNNRFRKDVEALRRQRAEGRPRYCSHCECTTCAACRLNVTRWHDPGERTLWKKLVGAPDPVMLESIETTTEPSFQFAYNPGDTDMQKIRTSHVLEALLTRSFHEAAAQCCAEPGGLVVDVGGNFGWYTLYSLALGCSVVVFEPVAEYRRVMRLGLHLNPGFARRVALLNNVVFSTHGNFTMSAAVGSKGAQKAMMGMAAMEGPTGLIKDVSAANPWAIVKRSVASAVSIDELITPRWLGKVLGEEWAQRPLKACLLKADVEGYEPQVLRSSRRFLSLNSVPALQMEITHPSPGYTVRADPKAWLAHSRQACEQLRMMRDLHLLGYRFHQADHHQAGSNLHIGRWDASNGPVARGALAPFPSKLTVKALAAANLSRLLPPLTKGRTPETARSVHRLHLFGYGYDPRELHERQRQTAALLDRANGAEGAEAAAAAAEEAKAAVSDASMLMDWSLRSDFARYSTNLVASRPKSFKLQTELAPGPMACLAKWDGIGGYGTWWSVKNKPMLVPLAQCQACLAKRTELQCNCLLVD